MSNPEFTSLVALDDCFAYGEQRLLHGEAIARLRAQVSSIADGELVALNDASGRIVKSPVVADNPIPAHTNAAVDGYGFAFQDYSAAAGALFPVVGRAAAGHPTGSPVKRQTALRILTGAVLPEPLDSVAMQEDCRLGDGGDVAIPAGLKRGANVRRAGEDVAKGTVLIDAGHRLRPQDLAALASAGCADVDCFRRLRVGLVSSGDEVVRAGSAALGLGQVFDANQPMLNGLMSLAGCSVSDFGIWRDDAAQVRDKLAEAVAAVDVLITTGGASRGDEDHMAAAISALGSVHFWQIAIKPGRPMMFGQIPRRNARPCLVVGLPGNPVAVFVCFLMYVMPMLRHMGGGGWIEPRRYRLPAKFTFTGRKPGRREFWRGMLVDTPQGLVADKFARDGSGLISGLRAADGLIEIAETAGDIAEGDLIDFIPFTEFGIQPG